MPSIPVIGRKSGTRSNDTLLAPETFSVHLTRTHMKTTMKLAFAFLVFFGFAVGAKGQVGIEPDTDLITLITYKTTGAFIKASDNDSASWYGTEVERSKIMANRLVHRLTAMNACGADTFKWVEDPDTENRMFTPGYIPKLFIHLSVSRTAVIADLEKTVAYGLYCIKRYNSYVEK
jgi:hypothetical protein